MVPIQAQVSGLGGIIPVSEPPQRCADFNRLTARAQMPDSQAAAPG